MLNINDTIAAISTPLGEGGIGIVKISGKDAIKITDKIFKSCKGKKIKKAKTYTVQYGWILDEHDIIDEVLVTIMKSPFTYTRQDVVEINCHGGMVPIRRILDLVLKNGTRLAQPGEFTKLAFLNGRIDLSQAEAVLDIIKAKTEQALRLGMGQLKGYLSDEIKKIRQRLVSILTQIESNIDFSEEDLDLLSKKEIKRDLKRLENRIIELLENSNQGRILRDGINVVICGKPNVGKSSLLNMLLRQERAIVTPIAGTTRDTIEEFVDIKGVPLRFVDTAGIIEPGDLIEKEAISRSRKYLESADLVLLVFDANRKLNREDRLIIKLSQGKENIVVLNKIDLPLKIETGYIKKRFKKVIKISATKNIGLTILENEIIKKIWQGKIVNTEGIAISNTRHIESLRKTKEHLVKSQQSLNQNFSWEFVALDVKLSIDSLGEITGHSIEEEILENIFSKFCIGK